MPRQARRISPWTLGPLLVGGIVAVIMLAALAGSLASLGAGADAACLAGPAGPGPGSVPGIPPQDLPVFEGAAGQFALGADGWAYLAALNYAESDFGTSPQPGVRSGANPAGAAGPMQIGIGGAATDNWDTYKLDIPGSLPGGTEPPSVYNEADAVYAAAAKLQHDGAPANWIAALRAWNDYQPEITQVTGLAWQYTQTAAPPGPSPTAASSIAVADSCAPVIGATTPSASATILPDGKAAIPASAPPPVQQAIEAGNRIIDTYYQAQRPEPLNTPMPWYDCSASTDYVLWNAGLDGPGVTVGGADAGDSTMLENYGDPSPGQSITVYASSGHAFIQVAGIVLDTSHYAPTTPAGSGPRWQPASIIRAQLKDGNAWTERHPPGL